MVIKIDIREAQTHLARYLTNLAEGETILLCKQGAPIAEIRCLPTERLKSRPIGLGKGTFEIPRAFFNPLPETITAAFNGNKHCASY